MFGRLVEFIQGAVSEILPLLFHHTEQHAPESIATNQLPQITKGSNACTRGILSDVVGVGCSRLLVDVSAGYHVLARIVSHVTL